MAPSIQVAFQGGGARFVEMLPIAHALAKAHSAGTIRITRVAGSSAGSICAALVATGADFEWAKEFITTEGLISAKAMRRWASDFGHGAWSDRARFATALLLAQQGISLLRTNILIDFLNRLFAGRPPKKDSKADGSKLAVAGPDPARYKAIPSIDEINSKVDGIKLAITGSDLSRSKGETFESGNLIERIGHSCAIPFALRTYADVSVSPYVDGGLCENLPVERLLADEDTDGPIFCVSIVDEEDQPYTPKSAKDYCLQLISASMNHNVERAKRIVGHSNVIEAKTRLAMFDFEGAVKKLADEKFYKDSYESAEKRLHQFAQLHSIVPRPSATFLSGRVSAPMIMRSLFRVFETSLGKPEWIYKKAAFVVRADGLKATPENDVKPADQVIRIATIQAKDNNLVCFSSSASLDAERSIVPTSWTCYNETKKQWLPVQAIPVQSTVAPSNPKRIGVLVFFESPVQSIDAGDIVTITSSYLLEGAMDGLKKEKATDHIGASNPHAIEIESVDVVLAYPTNFGIISAAPDNSAGDRPWALIKNEELEADYGSPVTEGYTFKGLRTQNLLAKQQFRGLFTRYVP